jgi:hypothetical protein
VSITAVENTMSVLAWISFFGAMAMVAIWLLAWSARMAGSRVPARPAGVDAGTPSADEMLVRLAHDPFAFLFDRSLAAAAAVSASRRSARESIASADGTLSITLSSPSRREVEIALTGVDQPPGTIAVVHVTDEVSDWTVLVPLSSISTPPNGLALLPTTSRRIGISRDVKLVPDANLAAFSAEDISQSVRASAGPTRERWQQLAAAARSGQTDLAEAVLSAILSALNQH